MNPTTKPLSPSERSPLIGIVGILLAHLVAMCLVMIVLVKTVPVYGVFFEQQNVVPPARTQAIVAFSGYCLVYFLPFIFVGMIIDAAFVFALGFAFHKRRRLLAAYSHLLLLVALAALVYVIAWLTNPISSSLVR